MLLLLINKDDESEMLRISAEPFAAHCKHWASRHVQAAGKPVNAFRFSLWVRGGLQHPLPPAGKPWFAKQLWVGAGTSDV